MYQQSSPISESFRRNESDTKNDMILEEFSVHDVNSIFDSTGLRYLVPTATLKNSVCKRALSIAKTHVVDKKLKFRRGGGGLKVHPH